MDPLHRPVLRYRALRKRIEIMRERFVTVQVDCTVGALQDGLLPEFFGNALHKATAGHYASATIRAGQVPAFLEFLRLRGYRAWRE